MDEPGALEETFSIMIRISSNIKKASWYFKNFGFKRLVYSAGMPRSGSTLLFNILRLVLEKKYNNLSCGWIEEVEKLPSSDVYLIKTHHLNRMAVFRSYKTFYTFRDVREVLVSRLKKFDKEPTIDIVRYYIRQDQIAKKYANSVFQYESMIVNLRDVVLNISKKMIIDLNPDEIIQQLPNPNEVKVEKDTHSKKTLLHKNHVTGTESGEWKQILPNSLIEQIHSEFEWWFIENGYRI